MHLSKLFSVLAAIVWLSSSGQAQIAVPNGGVGPITFGTTPLVTEWATISMAGSGPTSSTEAQLDAAIAALTAAGINTALPTSATVNPTVNGLFRHNTALSRIQSRPTTNNAAVLKATLLNGGATACGVTVSYVLGQYDTITEQIPGHRVYYSLNGTTWSAVGTFATIGAVNFNVIVGNWNNGSTLYLLWVDDNAEPGTDGSYTIDDVVFTPFVDNAPVSIVINTPTNTQFIIQGTSLNLTTTTTGLITNVAFYSDGGLLVSDASSPFGIVVTNLSLGGHILSAVAMNACGLRATSAPVAVNIISDTSVTVVSVSGPLSGAYSVFSNQTVGVSWIQSKTYADVRVSARLSGGPSNNGGVAYLTTRIGPGTTSAHAVAQSSFQFPNTSTDDRDVLLFSGLTLTGGTYYVTLVNAAPQDSGGWWPANPPVLTLDSGVTLGSAHWIGSDVVRASYPPASDFHPSLGEQLKFTVTGTTPSPTVITCPSNIVINCAPTNSAIVTYTVTATNAVGPPPVLVCVPPSGAAFTAGLTTVNCTATSAAGLSSSCNFTVSVSDGVTTPIWVQRLPGPADASARSFVAFDFQGDILVVAYSTGSSGNPSYYVTKYSGTEGLLLWQQPFGIGTSAASEAVGLGLDSSGNVLVAGTANYGSTDSEIYAAKYNGANGALLWEARSDSPVGSSKSATAMAVDTGGNVLVTGGYTTVKWAASDGTLLWQTTYNFDFSGAEDIALTPSGDVVVTGTFYNPGTGGSLPGCRTIKLATLNGALLWERTLPNPPPNTPPVFPHAVATDERESIVVTGLRGNSELIAARYTTNGSFSASEIVVSAATGHAIAVDANRNVFVTGISDNGTNSDFLTLKSHGTSPRWQVRYNGPANNTDVAEAIKVNASGDVFVTGRSHNGANFDFYTAKYSGTDGDLRWQTRYNGPANGDDTISGKGQLAVGPGGLVAVVGYSDSDPSPGVNRECTLVVYRDRAGPTIQCPGNISTNCAGPAGTPVAFSPTVVNAPCLPPASVACLPPSGAVFPFGSTPVRCTASVGDTFFSSCTFRDCSLGID